MIAADLVERILLETLERLDGGRGRRVERQFLINEAAQRGGFDPEHLKEALQRLLLRRTVVADVSNRILLPPGRARAGADR